MEKPENRRDTQNGHKKKSGASPTCAPHDHARRIAKRAPASDEALRRAASLFRAVGDIARLKLLERLAEGEWCVTELAEAADVGLSTVSQQLRTLREVNLIAGRRTGKHIYYSLADSHVMELVANALAHAAEELVDAGDA